MNILLYGIPNCGSVRKARKWLDARDIQYAFHDYKKQGADPAKLDSWADAVGWQVLLNKHGTTFRNLSDTDKVDIDRAKAIRLMAEHPSMIKRPVVEHSGGGILVGFEESEWSDALQ